MQTATPAASVSFSDGSGPRTLSADSISFLINPLWDYTMEDVPLRVQHIFEHVPIHPSFIKHWLKYEDGKLGGLLFPGSHMDVGSTKEPKIRILKHSPDTEYKNATSIQANISLYVFRREILESSELQPFDPAVWHPEAYESWCYMYDTFADAVGMECDADPQYPTEATLFVRRMMHTHFSDMGMIFSKKIWLDFGLGSMIHQTPHEFMRHMLMCMFMAYNSASIDLPPLFNAVTRHGSGRRVCAKCMIFKRGPGKMMRCPCQQVYYCDKTCQREDWKVHKLVCGK